MKKLTIFLSLIIAIGTMMFPVTHAMASVNICEINGSYCVGAPAIGAGDAVMETRTGRAIHEALNSDGSYKLEFSNDKSKCVGVDSNDKVIVRNCTDRTVDWTKIVKTGYVYWNNNSTSLYLAGHNNGTQMFVSILPLDSRGGTDCSNSCYEKFNQ